MPRTAVSGAIRMRPGARSILPSSPSGTQRLSVPHGAGHRGRGQGSGFFWSASLQLALHLVHCKRQLSGKNRTITATETGKFQTPRWGRRLSLLSKGSGRCSDRRRGGKLGVCWCCPLPRAAGPPDTATKHLPASLQGPEGSSRSPAFSAPLHGTWV